eukprot:2847076-Amphidinium_carterae.1
MIRGFSISIVGEVPFTGCFRPCLRSAVVSAEQLKRHSHWIRRAVANRRPSGDQDLARALWDETLAETARGHLRGPFSQKELDEKVGHDCWIPSLPGLCGHDCPEHCRLCAGRSLAKLGLTAAYKQCPLDSSQAQYAVVALDEPLDTATETSGKM